MTSVENLWEEFINSNNSNVDILYAKKIFFDQEKNIRNSFAQNVIERTDELRHMPDELFNHYFKYFVDFLINYNHDEFDRAEVADCFITLLSEKLDSRSITEAFLIGLAKDTLIFLEKNIHKFNTDPDIYGDLKVKIENVSNQLL